MRYPTYLAVLCLSLAAAAAPAAGPFDYVFSEIAPGVFTGNRPDSPRFPVLGNVTFVVSDAGVVVFDGAGLPVVADQVIAKIRTLTDLPVTHVIISHWHGDHHFGNYRYAEEFAGVEYIAHPFTDAAMRGQPVQYIGNYPDFIDRKVPEYRQALTTGVYTDGQPLDDIDRRGYERIVEDASAIDAEFERVRVTLPTITVADRLVIVSGERRVEIRHPGFGNTAGDLVMWLPEERIVAAGDIVVHPAPYAFNVPPRAWADTLDELQALDYALLVPGHGSVQSDTRYVDLLVESARSIADQRDRLLADGVGAADVEARLDFSALEARFTAGDPYLEKYYEGWFEAPFRASALKALGDEPMVDPGPPLGDGIGGEHWAFRGDGVELVRHLGRDAIALQGGAAVLRGRRVEDGVLEFDMAFGPEQGFVGGLFRIADENNFEHFYLRPHLSGKPDANQYTPVFNGVSGWQLYHGPGYSAAVDYRYNDWMHVKVAFAGDKADVFIDSDEPVLRIRGLGRDAVPGEVGIDASPFSRAWFSDVRVSALPPDYRFAATDRPVRQPRPGAILDWAVSDGFDGALLADADRLGGEIDTGRQWTVLKAGDDGTVNLARLQGLAEGRDTVFARVTIRSDARQVRALTFGYSDAVAVYLNGQRIYSGNNAYQSRDYRFLGTIGDFDTVHLDLLPGNNELRFAVTEAFGGWGLRARFEDAAGLEAVVAQ